ncbi:AT-rich interactive domain-containing protein 3-like isoform X2 [Carex rostrata]
MSGTNEHDLSQDEETNDEISQLPAETLTETPAAPRPLAEDFLDTVPIQNTGTENDKASDGDIERVTKMENGSDGMDEEREEESSEEVKEDREVKLEGTIVPFDDPISVAGPGSDLFLDGEDSGDEDEQAAFMQELERFHIEHNLEYKPPKFYGKGLNCLKLWRQVIKLGGYETVTSCKLWRQVGESFRPPKTCTTVSWSFRIFYEKALLEYEKYKIRTGELQIPESSIPEPTPDNRMVIGQPPGSNRVRRDAAQRAMDGWHSHRLLGNGEDKSPLSVGKKDKQVKIMGLGSNSKHDKKRKASSLERAFKSAARTKIVKSESGSMVIDVGAPADWVKVNVRQTKDCYEVYALVPGLLREEVHVQSDPAGRLVISGEPEQPDNPWGVTPFKKVISLPSRIDPHQTSAVVTLHGQLFVRVPFENSDM